jgi:cobaltochelatase CobS
MKKIISVKKLSSTQCEITLADNTKLNRRLYWRNALKKWSIDWCGVQFVFTFDNDGIATELKTNTITADFDKPVVKDTTSVKHQEYDTIKTCVEMNLPVYLYGPAGSGKNHTLEAIAGELGLAFYFTNSVQQEYKITGYMDAGGNYHDTEFYKAFTNGGLFFLDEMDASIPEVLVLLNAAIANRYFEFPNGRVNAHADFRVVAAGNTVGSGANEMYTGRLTLDQATLDRFVTIAFDYDINIERHLAKSDEELVTFIRELRTSAEQQGIRATFSYRAIMSVAALKNSNLRLDKILLIAVVKGLDKSTVATLKVNSRNKYSIALSQIQRAA